MMKTLQKIFVVLEMASARPAKKKKMKLDWT